MKGVIEDVLASQQGAFERRNLKNKPPGKWFRIHNSSLLFDYVFFSITLNTIPKYRPLIYLDILNTYTCSNIRLRNKTRYSNYLLMERLLFNSESKFINLKLFSIFSNAFELNCKIRK